MTPAQTHTHWMIGGFCFVTYNICNWNKQMSVCVTSKGHGKQEQLQMTYVFLSARVCYSDLNMNTSYRVGS